ncbi:MAG: hypothetical protein ISR85_00345 [Kiritimatiellales bacterium]|nr:hypothetical protein [Kiritimatiellota bacterium]MBL7011362.1 hypothetical protein [Kiritimatiellales bacterium]
MPIRNYRVIFEEVRRSRFLKMQAATLFLVTYIDWTLIPFVTKLEGIHLPVFMISFYMLLGALDGFVQPLFKHVKIYNIYLFGIVLDVIQIASYLSISRSIVLFTYVIVSIFTLQGITFEIARVHTVDFMQDEKVGLKDYMMICSFVISVAIVAGSLSAMIFDWAGVHLSRLLIYLAAIGLGGILLQIKLYRKFHHRSCSAEVSIERDHKELFEKFR